MKKSFTLCLSLLLTLCLCACDNGGGDTPNTPDNPSGGDPDTSEPDDGEPDDGEPNDGEPTHEHTYIYEQIEGDSVNHLVLCVDDDYSETEPHEYKEYTVPATCTEDGYITYTCEKCEYTYTETLEKLGHDLYYVSDGVNGHHEACTRCDYVTETVSHDYEETYYPDGETGHYQVCSLCSYRSDDEEHNWGEPQEVTAPGCETSGENLYTCTVCDATKTEAIAPLGHDYDTTNWEKDGTNHWHICTRCSAIDPDSVAAHTYGAYSITDDDHSHTCTVCNYEESGVHEWGDGVITTQPGCETTGVRTYTCSVCGDTKTEEVAATGHNPASTWTIGDTTHWHECLNGCGTHLDEADHETSYKQTDTSHYLECSVCGWTDTEETHTFTYSEIEGNNDVHLATCETCGYETTVSHTYTDVITEPTCTTEGYTTHTCEVCGHTYVDNYVSELGHAYVYTDLGDGANHLVTCSRGDYSETEEHTYEGDDPVCTKCGYELPHLEFTLDESTSTYSVTGMGTYTGTEIVIPDTYKGLPVTSVAASAFAVTAETTEEDPITKIESVYVGKNVESIGNYAFTRTTATGSDGNPTSATETSFHGITSLTFDEECKITTIGEEAFKYSAVTEVNIPDTVSSLGYRAFEYCTELERIHLPDLITGTGSQTLRYCYSLAEIDISENTQLDTFGNGAFGYTHISSIYWPKSVTTLQSSCFSHLDGSSNSDSPYGYNGTLEAVYYGGTAEEWTALTQSSDFTTSNNTVLTDGTASIYYYSEEATNYGWHWVDGVPTPWYASNGFSLDSWETIASIAEAGYASSVYSIGDTKDITLTTDETLTMRIIGFDHDTISGTSEKAGLTLETVGLTTTQYSWNAATEDLTDGTNAGGWDACELRSTLNSEIYGTLPEEIKSSVKTVDKEANTGYGTSASDVKVSEDKLFCLSVVEIYGAEDLLATTNGSYSPYADIYSIEGSQYEFYTETVGTEQDLVTSHDTLKKTYNTSTPTWWTRTANLSGEARVIPIYDGRLYASTNSKDSYHISFCFCL